jgi:hypothetical protein
MKMTLMAITLTGLVFSALAAEPSTPIKAKAKAKPYILKTCPVSGEKLDGDMGKPYVFEENGRQIKLCCKSCLKDFKKDPSNYIKQIEAAEKKQESKN